MFPNPISRLVALVGLSIMPSAASAVVKADHCDSITSSDGRYRASFTLVRNSDPTARTIRIFLCDRSNNCDTVFEAPRDAKVSMQWRSSGNLAVLATRGALVAPGTFDSIAKGRPPVRIVTWIDDTDGSPGKKLDFAAGRCRVEAPIASTATASPF
jgi:hypothetical protein